MVVAADLSVLTFRRCAEGQADCRHSPTPFPGWTGPGVVVPRDPKPFPPRHQAHQPQPVILGSSPSACGSSKLSPRQITRAGAQAAISASRRASVSACRRGAAACRRGGPCGATCQGAGPRRSASRCRPPQRADARAIRQDAREGEGKPSIRVWCHARAGQSARGVSGANWPPRRARLASRRRIAPPAPPHRPARRPRACGPVPTARPRRRRMPLRCAVSHQLRGLPQVVAQREDVGPGRRPGRRGLPAPPGRCASTTSRKAFSPGRGLGRKSWAGGRACCFRASVAAWPIRTGARSAWQPRQSGGAKAIRQDLIHTHHIRAVPCEVGRAPSTVSARRSGPPAAARRGAGHLRQTGCLQPQAGSCRPAGGRAGFQRHAGAGGAEGAGRGFGGHGASCAVADECGVNCRPRPSRPLPPQGGAPYVQPDRNGRRE